MNRNPIRAALLAVTAACLLNAPACTTAPTSAEGRSDLRQDAAAALSKAQRDDPTLAARLRDAAAYAVFPTVGKGAIGVGGAYGKGILYEGGESVGYCDMTQGSIGLQLGGQAYTEVIAFETKNAVNTFKGNNLTFHAQATAVALKSGAGASAKYADGVMVFTTDQSGLMFEASIGGQQFTYQAKTAESEKAAAR